jgi:signal transduction histidine kinase
VLFVLSFANPAPQQFGQYRLSTYLTIPDYDRLGVLWTVTNLAFVAIFWSAIASLVIRYRRGGDVERRQLLWLLLAVLIVAVYGGVIWGVFASGPILGLLVFTLIPASIAVATLRYQLLDIRVVVSRALVYGLLTAAAAGAYVGMVALLDLVVRSRVSLGAAVVASVIVAIGFNPARVRLQRVIDRAFYGDRRDPVRAVSLVGERLADPGAAGLASVLQALCESLRLPFAQVRSAEIEVAAYGTPPELLHAIPLRYDGTRIGELIVGLRTGQGRLGPGALGEQSDRLAQRPDGGSVPVQISAPASLPPLPAAVEVAAYRIITEAMTNAARHSGASSIQVRLECAADAILRLEVKDNGGTPGSPWKPGVGLISIRERAAELGGSCQAGPDPDGGGLVAASCRWTAAATVTAGARASRS